MFETLQNGLSIDVITATLASAGVTPAVAIFAVLAGVAALVLAAQKARSAADALVAYDEAQPKSRADASPAPAPRLPIRALSTEDAGWSRAA